MPRFYFHVITASRRSIDTRGLIFPDEIAARSHADTKGRQILDLAATEGITPPQKFHIEIVDERGRAIDIIEISSHTLH